MNQLTTTTLSLSSALATGHTATIDSALYALGAQGVAQRIATLPADDARQLAQALYSAHYSQRDRDEANALAAIGQYREAAEAAKASLRKLRDAGTPPLTVEQGQAVLEILKLASALNDVCGKNDLMAAQFVEAITDTTGYSTVEDNVTATLIDDEPPAAPDWSKSFATSCTDSARSDLAMELFEARHRLSFAAVAAAVSFTASQNSAALVAALAP